MFSFTLNCWDTVEMKVKWIDDPLFKEGKTVVIHMGYRDQLKKIFTGEINGLEPEFHTSEAPLLTVRGYDRGQRLMRKRKTKSYLRMKDSDIARQIASNSGLSPEVEDSSVMLEYVLQHNQTDLGFLQHRAERIVFEFFAQDHKLSLRPRQTSGAEALTLRREIELLEFYPRSTTLNQVEEVVFQGWDPKKKREVSAESRPGNVRGKLGANSGPDVVQKAFRGTQSVEVRSPLSSQEEAGQRAHRPSNRIGLSQR